MHLKRIECIFDPFLVYVDAQALNKQGGLIRINCHTSS